MQAVTVICVGRLGQPFLQQGCAEYAKRLSAFCELRLVELPEETIREKAAGEAEIRRALEKEGERILAAVPKNASLVALCIEGKQLGQRGAGGLFAGAGRSPAARTWPLPSAPPTGCPTRSRRAPRCGCP